MPTLVRLNLSHNQLTNLKFQTLGNYFVMGGDIDGGKVLGTYPHNLTNDNELIFAPGIVIPTLPWESIWNGLAQWFGVKEEDLDDYDEEDTEDEAIH